MTTTSARPSSHRELSNRRKRGRLGLPPVQRYHRFSKLLFQASVISPIGLDVLEPADVLAMKTTNVTTDFLTDTASFSMHYLTDRLGLMAKGADFSAVAVAQLTNHFKPPISKVSLRDIEIFTANIDTISNGLSAGGSVSIPLTDTPLFFSRPPHGVMLMEANS